MVAQLVASTAPTADKDRWRTPPPLFATLDARTTFLVPAFTDLPWWHDLVWDAEHSRFRPGVAVEFFRRRVRFLRPDGTLAGTPHFPSVAVTFGGW
jgi:hypothetical protein